MWKGEKMSEWKDDDEVTTTYGSIQLARKQAHAAGMEDGVACVVQLLKVRQEAAILKKLESTDPLKIAGHFAIEHALDEIIQILEKGGK